MFTEDVQVCYYMAMRHPSKMFSHDFFHCPLLLRPSKATAAEAKSVQLLVELVADHGTIP